MTNIVRALICVVTLVLLLPGSLLAQSENRETKGRPTTPRNPRWTVIIDYVDTFTGHKPKHQPNKPPGGEEPPPEPDNTHLAGHFDLIGGRWADSNDGTTPVDPALNFIVDLRGFPSGSDQAIANAFSAWDVVTAGNLTGGLFPEDAIVSFGDGVNTYSMRNLGGGGVLAATFITWDDADNDGTITTGEEFLEMDVVHNSTVKWAIAEIGAKGRWWDVQNVATHEVGHVFGLTHPGNTHEEDKPQTMFASAPPKEDQKRTLETNGDVPGIQDGSLLGYLAP